MSASGQTTAPVVPALGRWERGRRAMDLPAPSARPSGSARDAVACRGALTPILEAYVGRFRHHMPMTCNRFTKAHVVRGAALTAPAE